MGKFVLGSTLPPTTGDVLSCCVLLVGKAERMAWWSMIALFLRRVGVIDFTSTSRLFAVMDAGRYGERTVLLLIVGVEEYLKRRREKARDMKQVRAPHRKSRLATRREADSDKEANALRDVLQIPRAEVGVSKRESLWRPPI